MKFRTLLNIAVLLVISEALIAITLLNANRRYEMQNRQLIIQNDSILSVNMELSRRSAEAAEKISLKN